ncbi:hypothetical protein FGRMN_11129 [Fusarium graminum]|nr:hypothetical protein FGRMN_11129 [Fusarium graminum]
MMTGYSKSAAPRQPASMEIPGLTLVKPGDTPKNAPKGLRKGQPVPNSLPPRPKIPTGPKSSKKVPPPQQQPQRSESPPKPPSKASGGVPNPTAQYLAQAKLSPERLAKPRRILIVMDLNGTLLHRPNKRRPFHFTERPHATTFLSYLLETFHVAIWSSARPENVNKMVEQLLTPEQVEQCLVVWGRDSFGLSGEDYNSKVQVYKRLTTIWTNPRVMAAHPRAHKGGLWDQTNTILVDDSFEKGRSEPFNMLILPEFAGLAKETPNVLPQVHDYINELAHQSDISRFVRQSPFKPDPDYILPEQPV